MRPTRWLCVLSKCTIDNRESLQLGATRGIDFSLMSDDTFLLWSPLEWFIPLRELGAELKKNSTAARSYGFACYQALKLLLRV